MSQVLVVIPGFGLSLFFSAESYSVRFPFLADDIYG